MMREALLLMLALLPAAAWAQEAAPFVMEAEPPSTDTDLACADGWELLSARLAAISQDGVFAIVPAMPELIPSNVEGLRVLQERLVYPEAAQEQGIQGRVFVQFIIDERGVPTCLRVGRGVHPLLDQAALDAVAGVRFRSNCSRCRPQKMPFSLPVTFQLR